jgi:hypothetical protein
MRCWPAHVADHGYRGGGELLGIIIAGVLNITGMQSATDLDLPPEVRATTEAATKQLEIVKGLNGEISALTANGRKIDASAALRKEEAESLRLRYPNIVVSDTFTSAQFSAALIRYNEIEKSKLRIAANNYELANRAHLCVMANDIRKQTADLLASDGWKQMTLAERMKEREPLDAMLADINGDGDKCKPLN